MSIAEALELVRKRKEPLVGLHLKTGAAVFYYRSVVIEFAGATASARTR